MRRRCQHHPVPCHDELIVLISPSGRVVLKACWSCGFEIRVDGRVVTAVAAPFTTAQFLLEVESVARAVPAIPATELRAFADAS